MHAPRLQPFRQRLEQLQAAIRMNFAIGFQGVHDCIPGQDLDLVKILISRILSKSCLKTTGLPSQPESSIRQFARKAK
jgi:hypothetical protein